jgi:hypothetical protein
VPEPPHAACVYTLESVSTILERESKWRASTPIPIVSTCALSQIHCWLPWKDSFMARIASGDIPADPALPDYEFFKHLEALGLKTVEECQAWSAGNGFTYEIDADWLELCRKRQQGLAYSDKKRRTGKKSERNPRKAIQDILGGKLHESDLTSPDLLLLHDVAAAIHDDAVRDALEQLLRHVEGRTTFLTNRPAVTRLGFQRGNTFLEALLCLAKNHADWKRPPESWRPLRHNPLRQFATLARHLLANYEVPKFMDSVWFSEPSQNATRQQQWFKELGEGKSVRSLDLPVPLTKRMAHHFIHSPYFSVETAIRWGQVIGLGGDYRLVRAILASRLGTNFDRNEFWITVMRWFVQNPQLNRFQVGPLIDYIHYRKFEPTATITRSGERKISPPDSGFSMKGRNAASLLRQMHQWHIALADFKMPDVRYRASSIQSFDWTDDEVFNKPCRWTITQILSRHELHREGKAMQHCVATYDNRCRRRTTSIWSMGVERIPGRRTRVLTIEVANTAKSIRQVCGWRNRSPSSEEKQVLRKWIKQERLTVGPFLRI